MLSAQSCAVCVWRQECGLQLRTYGIGDGNIQCPLAAAIDPSVTAEYSPSDGAFSPVRYPVASRLKRKRLQSRQT